MVMLHWLQRREKGIVGLLQRQEALKDTEILGMELSSDSTVQVDDESGTLVDEDSDDEEKNDDSSQSDVNDEILQEACCSIDQDDIA